MTISRSRDDLEKDKFVESTSTANQPGVAVVNPDGSNLFDGDLEDTVNSITLAIVSVGTTAVELTATTNQKWIRIVPTTGNFRWAISSPVSSSAEKFNKNSAVTINCETQSIYIVKTSGSAVDVAVYRGIRT